MDIVHFNGAGLDGQKSDPETIENPISNGRVDIMSLKSNIFA